MANEIQKFERNKKEIKASDFEKKMVVDFYSSNDNDWKVLFQIKDSGVVISINITSIKKANAKAKMNTTIDDVRVGGFDTKKFYICREDLTYACGFADCAASLWGKFKDDEEEVVENDEDDEDDEEDDEDDY